MKSVRRFFTRLVNSAMRRAQDERLREEVEQHIALQTEENLRAGLSPIEARRQAMLKFGGVEAMKQDYRAERGLLSIEHLLGDLRNAARTISRMPGLAAVVILSLAIGIGVNTTIFSWIQLMMFEPMPAVGGASKFLLIEPHSETGGYPGASWLEYRDLQAGLPALRDILAWEMAPFNVGEKGQTDRTFGQLVSGNYFSALGLKPAIGRFIQPQEAERPGTEPVVVISYDYWQTRFAGAPGVVGQKMRVNDRELTIIGVAPQHFQGTMVPLKFELWVPATMTPTLLAGARDLEDRTARSFSLIAMLRPGATREEAQAQLSTAMARFARDYPEANAGVSGDVLSFWQSPRGPQRLLMSGLAILQGVMLLLLLAVCGNTANLMLARGSTRQREMAVRLALGAGRWRIASLVLSENMLLALLGAGLGIAFAVWGTTALRLAPLIGAFPIQFQTGVDGFTLALQPRAQSSDGSGSRASDGGPDRCGTFSREFPLRAPNRPAIPDRRRSAGRLRLKRTEPRRRLRARLCRAPAGTVASLARRRGRRYRHERPARPAWNSRADFHRRRPRAHGGRAGSSHHQHGHPGILQSDGHPDS